MSSMYKVTKIEGKGLGCVATSDIKKGSLILIFNPQLCVETEETEGSSMWIKSLLKSFYQMSKTDQHEFMTLYNRFNNFQNFQNSEDEDIQNLKEILAKMVEICKLEIGKFEQDPEKAEKILKICGIYSTNSFEDGVCFKTSRFNHSCQPNAGFFKRNGQNQLRAIGNIKAGEEINLNYRDELFAGFRNRKYRRQNLFEDWGFLCSCDLCKNDVDIDAEAFEDFIQEAEKLTIERKSAFNAGTVLEATRYYSLENCRKEVSCYKQLYKLGRSKNIQPYFLYSMLDQGFSVATFGYQMYKNCPELTEDLKMDAMNFAKAAEKFGKILGTEIVTRGNPNHYKKDYKDMVDKQGY